MRITMVLLVLATLACSLGQNETDSSAQITPIANITTTATTASSTATPAPTNTTVANTSGGSNPGNTNNTYLVNLPAPFPACSVSPTGDFTVNIRSNTSTTAPIVGILNKAAWVQVDWHNNGWYRVHYPNTPVDNMWISDGPVTLTQPCVCAPDCTSSFTPPQTGTACVVTNNSGETAAIFNEPGLVTGEFIARFQPGATMEVMAFSTGGWIKVKFDVPNSVGWVVGRGMTVGVTGCDQIPIEEVAPTRACQVTNISSEPVTIFTQPDGDYFGRFPPNQHQYAVARRGTDWYKIYVAAFSNYGWVRTADTSTNGSCAALPEE